MSRFRHILFVCQNDRDPSDPRGSCTARGSASILERMKALTKERGLKGKVRVTGSGCLDLCAKGCTVVAFSEGQGETWYTRVKPEDAEALFESHVVNGQRLERLVDKA